MLKRLLSLVLLVVLTGCNPGSGTPRQATVIPFPTVTPGRSIVGVLSPENALVPGASGLSNPATAVAQGFQPTATPNAAACPQETGATLLAEPPDNDNAIAAEIARYLSAGGIPSELQDDLRDEWGILGDAGFVRADIDLTGEGPPEIIISYALQSDSDDTEDSPPRNTSATLLITGCEDRTYVVRYLGTLAESNPPEIILLGDMNHDERNDLLFSFPLCEPVEDEDDEPVCKYQTQLITWQPDLGRFANLLQTSIISDNLPTTSDPDTDDVTEIIVHQDDDGNADTGPLRTGTYIYDWDGSEYVLSNVQPDPPAYRIQVIHEGDRYFALRDMDTAIGLYQVALDDPDLRPWINDETPLLNSYALYRLLVAMADADIDNILPVYQRIAETFPETDPATVYVLMARTFWDAFQITFDMTAACQEVLNVVAAQPEAVDLLNRYGSRSPTYTAQDLCPF